MDEYDYYNQEDEAACMVAGVFAIVTLTGFVAAVVWAIVKLAGWRG